MGFVHDDGVIGVQIGVVLGFSQQDAVGHYFDEGVLTGFFLEADLVPYSLSQVD